MADLVELSQFQVILHSFLLCKRCGQYERSKTPSLEEFVSLAVDHQCADSVVKSA
jgi:hypothetical protein